MREERTIWEAVEEDTFSYVTCEGNKTISIDPFFLLVRLVLPPARLYPPDPGVREERVLDSLAGAQDQISQAKTSMPAAALQIHCQPSFFCAYLKNMTDTVDKFLLMATLNGNGGHEYGDGGLEYGNA